MIKFIFLPVAFFLSPLIFAIDLNAQDWPNHIKNFASAYEMYLPNQYACLCTKLAHQAFASKTRADELKKLEQLKSLKAMLNEDGVGPQRISAFISNEMAPFLDDYGQNFQKACLELIPPPAPKAPRSCSICFEQEPSIIYLPCGHLRVCHDCQAKMEHLSCPFCRQEVKKVVDLNEVELHDLCIKCQEKPADIYLPQKKAIEFCETCFNQLAQKADHKAHIKIFFSEQDEV